MNAAVWTREQTGTGALILVNQAHPIQDNSALELIPADPRYPETLLERHTAHALQACVRAVGGKESIVPVSGWRSREEQQAIWDDTLAREGEAFTRQYVALPGCSEHQTGLAIDLGGAAEKIDFIRPDFPYDGPCGAFRQEAARYGLIQRYGREKENITGIAEEPWHFRYVGTPHAEIMVHMDLALEEYLSLLREQFSAGPLYWQSGGWTYYISYVEMDGAAEFRPVLGPDTRYTVSGDNMTGLIVTVRRRGTG